MKQDLGGVRVGNARVRWQFQAARFNHFRWLSMAAEITGGQILVAFLPKHGLRSNSECLILKIFLWGACRQTLLACYVYSHPSTMGVPL